MYKVLSFLFLVTLLSSGSSVIAADANPNCKTLWEDVQTKLVAMQHCIDAHHVKDCDLTAPADVFCACRKDNINAIRKDCKDEMKAFHTALKDAHGCIRPHHSYPTCTPSKKSPVAPTKSSN